MTAPIVLTRWVILSILLKNGTILRPQGTAMPTVANPSVLTKAGSRVGANLRNLQEQLNSPPRTLIEKSRFSPLLT